MDDDHVLSCDCCGEVRLWPPLAGLGMGFLEGRRCLGTACYAHGPCDGRYRVLKGPALEAIQLELAAQPREAALRAGPEGWPVRPRG
ncbi:MAG: hypothetical protein QOI63_66, partial [Thermoplasmata archaeon]|nr:hypothetical protein [Thermoplasmata archaeon]